VKSIFETQELSQKTGVAAGDPFFLGPYGGSFPPPYALLSTVIFVVDLTTIELGSELFNLTLTDLIASFMHFTNACASNVEINKCT